MKLHAAATAERLSGVVSPFSIDYEHIDALRTHVLAPWLAAQKRNACLRLWSMSCATGAEALALAMAVVEALPDWQRLDIRILATDVDAGLVSSAQRGIFDESQLAGLSATLQARWFKPRARHGASRLCKVQPELTALIRYGVLEPQAKLAFSGPIDAIFCRNSLAYWEPGLQQHMLATFAGLQPRRGLLCLGANERHLLPDAGYRRLGPGLFKRIETP
jgi:chemotaxis protein methyltransferase CheR